MLGMMISTGGSNITPAGCNVYANGGAAPSGMGMGKVGRESVKEPAGFFIHADLVEACR